MRNSIVFELEFFSAARHPMCASHLSYVCLLRADNRAACWSPVGGHIRSVMCAHKGHAGVARHVLEAMSLWDPAALVANAMHDIRDAATFSCVCFRAWPAHVHCLLLIYDLGAWDVARSRGEARWTRDFAIDRVSLSGNMFSQNRNQIRNQCACANSRFR